MTKLENCAIEDANPGQVYLYPEGIFYKAYQKSAWILCTKVHPFKVSSRLLKGLEGPLLSVGFPQSSLDKFSARVLICNLYKEVKDPYMIAKIYCHVEKSRAFSRYRDIDEEMAKEVILKLE